MTARDQILWRCGRTRAFTLVEVSVIVVVAGIIAATVVPAWSSMDGTRQAAAAEEVERRLTNARSQAVAEGRPVGLRVDPVSETIQTYVITVPGAAPTVAVMGDGQPDPVFNISTNYPTAAITSLVAGDGSGTAQVLWFGYDGSPQLRNGSGTLVGPWTSDALITMPGGMQVIVRKTSGLVQR